MAREIAVPPVDAGAVARLYNALAGGIWADAGEEDLAAALEVGWPGTAQAMLQARESHARAAAWAVGDAGGCGAVVFGASGFPAPGLPHDRAALIAPSARFFYADEDPEAVAAAEEALGAGPARAVRGGVLDPGALHAACGLDPVTPVMVQIQMAAHFWPGGAAAAVVSAWAGAMPAGSVLYLSLFCALPQGRGRQFLGKLGGAVRGSAFSHSPQAVRGWLAGAGLEVLGARDVRAGPGREWAEEAGLAPFPVRAIEAAGRVR